jgi:hypothetical protein
MTGQCRSRPPALVALTALDAAAHETLKQACKASPSFWTAPPEEHKETVRAFKKEVKEHYFHGQTRRCCYCSKELDDHHGTFDAEHILDRKEFPEFMFELSNIAAACKPCNGAKSIKSALVAAVPKPTVIPDTSHAYRIVHPLLDEWGEHLEMDDLNRIRPKGNSAKGAKTIEVCGIQTLNSARLADHFQPARQVAERALRGFFRVKKPAWRKKYVGMLTELAEKYDLAPAKAIVDQLRTEAGKSDVLVLQEGE